MAFTGTSGGAQEVVATTPTAQYPASVAPNPSFTIEPQSQTVNVGTSVAFYVAGTGATPSFQWSFNGATLSDGNGISGATTPVLFLSGGVSVTDAGSYTCTMTNSAGSVTSAAALLSVVNDATPGRLIDLSTSALVSTGSDILIAGFTVKGTGSKAVILRGVGPSLGTFNVPETLADPVLSLYDAANPAALITSDSGWQNPPQAPSGRWLGMAIPDDASASDFAQVGAFGLLSGSADSALKITLPAGGYTSLIASANNSQGAALAEIYDADGPDAQTEIVNLSSRAFIAHASIMTAGFVISGSTSETVLIRVSGPALQKFAAQDALSDPQVQLFDNKETLIASNQGWLGSAQISDAASSVGAFAWTDPSSADAGLLITLPPGTYTAQASAVSGDSGVALVEVYALK